MIPWDGLIKNETKNKVDATKTIIGPVDNPTRSELIYVPTIPDIPPMHALQKIIVDKCRVQSLAVSGGIINSADINITPTAWMPVTIVSTIKKVKQARIHSTGNPIPFA